MYYVVNSLLDEIRKAIVWNDGCMSVLCSILISVFNMVFTWMKIEKYNFFVSGPEILAIYWFIYMFSREIKRIISYVSKNKYINEKTNLAWKSLKFHVQSTRIALTFQSLCPECIPHLSRQQNWNIQLSTMFYQMYSMIDGACCLYCVYTHKCKRV